MRTRTVFLLAVLAALPAGTALAAKPSVVAKLGGRAYEVHANDTHWLACWAEQPDGKYKLMLIDSDKGNSTQLAVAGTPGGLCWVPRREELLYCTGAYVEQSKSWHVTYYAFDVSSLKPKQAPESRKVTETTDLLETFQFNPLAADDGSKVFHMTLGVGSLPSFNTYVPETGRMELVQAAANIASDYDLSSDGTRLYWMMHDPGSGAMSIVEWSLDANGYSNLYTFPKTPEAGSDPKKALDPADDHTALRVDIPHRQAAALVTSEKNSRLQLCVYRLDDRSAMPVFLYDDEQIESYDWKGRTGLIYALISNTKTKQYTIEEIDALTGKRTVLLQTSDQVYCLDFGTNGAYYYTVVDNRNPNNPSTLVMRLR